MVQGESEIKSGNKNSYIFSQGHASKNDLSLEIQSFTRMNSVMYEASWSLHTRKLSYTQVSMRNYLFSENPSVTHSLF